MLIFDFYIAKISGNDILSLHRFDIQVRQ